MVVLELFRRQHILNNFQLYYWRTQSGLEVDIILQTNKDIYPIEIKASKNIKVSDVAGLSSFLKRYKTKHGYVVSMDQKPYKLTSHITVVPWNYL